MGFVTAAVLITVLMELGQANAAEISALVGVAPMNRDSGIWRGQRMIRGGRKYVRNALYMASINAIRVNPDNAAFYKRLRLTGKKFKVAITAVMRRLAILANTLITQSREWAQVCPCCNYYVLRSDLYRLGIKLADMSPNWRSFPLTEHGTKASNECADNIYGVEKCTPKIYRRASVIF